MLLATQYYRAPFPNRHFWADDLSLMRDSGLHAVQLWCVWGWIEAAEGTFNYDDYDELVGLADERGLKVVLSTIAAIHPFWIHRAVPDSEMIDHTGRKVISSCRTECNSGLTPGGCLDHPGIRERMGRFLTDIATHYRGASNIIGWDCWNETRWCVQAGGHVCYCPHTLEAFREWLSRRHGGLRGLCKAWQRRYGSWEDVLPANSPTRPYTGTVEFLRFLAHRAAEHAKFRYDAIRTGDPKRFISAHASAPAIHDAGGHWEQAMCRGSDWDLADRLDGLGCSHFPFWDGGYGDIGLRVRTECTRSACRGKPMWVSELQGAMARRGFNADKPVDAASQQRWIAHAMSRNAKAAIFWCWRDEVFGLEAGGFGISGWDGLAGERLAELKRTRRFLDEAGKLIDDYRMDSPQVGVLFVPDNYMLNWAETGDIQKASGGVNGYAEALERLRIPYQFVEARRPDEMKGLRVLLMPWCPVLPDETRKAILAFVRAGGRVVFEAETDSFDELGFFRYGDERPLLKALGLVSLGRRRVDDGETIPVDLAGDQTSLVPEGFITAFRAPRTAEVLATDEQDRPLVLRRKLGKGAAYAAGCFFGRSYHRERNEGLERLISHVCDDAGVQPAFDVSCGDEASDEETIWRSGRAAGKRMLWIINNGDECEVTVTSPGGRFRGARSAKELRSRKTVPINSAGGRKQCSLSLPAGEYALLCWPA